MKTRPSGQLIKTLATFLLVIFVSGCAMGRTTDYSTGMVNYNTEMGSQTHVLVSVEEVRPYVLNGNKSSNFVGLQRSLAGIPYPVSTKSGNPLVDDFGSLITKSLRSEGVDAEYIAFPIKENIDTFIQNNSQEGRSFLVFSFHEWKTDIYMTASLHYNVSLSVYDSKGNKLASARQKGADELGDDQRPERKNLATANIDIIGSLLNAPQVKTAITKGTPETAVKKATPETKQQDECSVGQILTMKNSGLSDAKISAACN